MWISPVSGLFAQIARMAFVEVPASRFGEILYLK